MNEIIDKFKNGQCHLADIEEWTKVADSLDKKIKGSKEKEKFWQEILDYIIEKERVTSKHYPKLRAHVYLRLAVKKLLGGRSYETVFKYLKFAQNEIRIECDKKGDFIAEDHVSFRFEKILQCLLQYKSYEPRKRSIVEGHLNNIKERSYIHETLCILYDLTGHSAKILTLPWAPFDKLLGRNKYRVNVNENYDGAVWLCERIDEIHRKLNQGQYGLAKAVIVLCGATVEGILAKDGRLSRLPAFRKQKVKTFGSLVWMYIDNLRPPPDVVILFIFLLSLRNQIHPTNSRNRKMIVDMPLAFYVLRLTERIIIRLSGISRKRNKYSR